MKKKSVLYQGQINDLSQAGKLLEVIKQTKNYIAWHIAGPINEKYKKFLYDLVDNKNVFYYGFVTNKQLMKIRSKCNIGIVSWGNKPNNTYKYAAPNKLYEYSASGMFVLSFHNYSLNKLNKKYNFGYVCTDENKDVIETIKILKNLTMDDLKQKSIQNYNLYKTELNFEKQSGIFVNDLIKLVEKIQKCKH